MADAARAAFRELHGPRLHGFALLVALGDRRLAARAAGQALAEGVRRVSTLSHPERAAAWLRERVVNEIRRHGRRRAGDHASRRAALDPLDVDDVAYAGLASLGVTERAALVASAIEGLDRRDVATIVGIDGTRLERLVRRARARAIRGANDAIGDVPALDGPLATAVAAIARRTLT